MAINNPVQTRLSELELEEMEEWCSKRGMKPAAFLREMYRKGVEKEALFDDFLGALERHKIAVQRINEERFAQLERRLLEEFDSKLEEFRFRLLRAIEQRQ